MKRITIKGKEYILRNSIRNSFIYEGVKGKPFPSNPLTIDIVMMFYSTLKANNADEFKMTFSDFISAIDDDTSLMESYMGFLMEENADVKKKGSL